MVEISRRGLVAVLVTATAGSGLTALGLALTESGGDEGGRTDRGGRAGAGRPDTSGAPTRTRPETTSSRPTETPTETRTPTRTTQGISIASTTIEAEYDAEFGTVTLYNRGESFTRQNTGRLVVEVGSREHEWPLPVRDGGQHTFSVERRRPIEVVWHGPDGDRRTLARIPVEDVVDRPGRWPALSAEYDRERRRLTLSHAGGVTLESPHTRGIEVSVEEETRATLEPPIERGDSVTIEVEPGQSVNIFRRREGGVVAIGRYEPGGEGWGVSPPSASWSFEAVDGAVRVCHDGGDTFEDENTLELGVIVDGDPGRVFPLPASAGDCRRVEASGGDRVEVVWTAANMERTTVLASYRVP